MKSTDHIADMLEEFMNAQIERCIYNEFALQFELGHFFRSKGFDVFFERNINSFEYKENPNNPRWAKHEIDLVIEREGARYAIELKFPRNGEYPEQMYSFLKDILFMEQVLDRAEFDGTYTLTVTLDPLFYTHTTSIRNNNTCTNIYSLFRTGDTPGTSGYIPASVDFYKPTGKKLQSINMARPHLIEWKTSNAPWNFLSKKDGERTLHYYICIC